MIWVAMLVAVAAGDAPPSFDAFFADFAKKRDAIHSMEAHFTQKNVSPEETVDSSGTLVYVKPRRIVFRYDKPDAGMTYLINDRRAYEYEPDIKQLQVFDLEKNPQTEVFFLGFEDNTDELRKAYDVEDFETGDKPVGSHGIIIRPKVKDNEHAHFREVRLFLRDIDYLPYRIHIDNDNEAKVDISITGLVINGKLDPARTQITLAEGTKIIDNDEVVETVGPGGKSVPETRAVVSEPLAEPAKPKDGADR
jgi:outer membrane lipoprotein-sorting protein